MNAYTQSAKDLSKEQDKYVQAQNSVIAVLETKLATSQESSANIVKSFFVGSAFSLLCVAGLSGWWAILKSTRKQIQRS